MITIFFIVLLIILFYYFISLNINKKSIIQNKTFSKLSNYLPQNVKNVIKKFIFPHKFFQYKFDKKMELEINKLELQYGFELNKFDKKNQNPLNKQNFLIKTTAQNCFEIKKNDKIFIHKNKFNIDNIKINAFSKNTKNQCFNLKLNDLSKNKYIIYNNNNIIIQVDFFFEKFSDAIFFQIIVDNFFYGYFAIDNRRQYEENKNLLVFPTTNFFNYNSNLLEINKYSSIEYIVHPNEIPTTTINTWHGIDIENDFYKSMTNQLSIFKDFDILNDYTIENIRLDKYKNIIFPMHQEYISETILKKLINIMNSQNTNIVSIGGANFLNNIQIQYDDNKIKYINYFQNENERINFKKYNLNSYNWSDYKDCVYKSDENFLKGITFSGEMMDYKNNDNSESYFFNIISKNNNKLPVFTVTKFNKGKLIQFNSDYVAVRFLDSKKLTEFFKSLISDI